MALAPKPTKAWEVNCSVHKIYCQIKENKNHIDQNYAMKLSNMIYRYSRKYEIPSEIYTAILMQESGYRLVNSTEERLRHETEEEAFERCQTTYEKKSKVFRCVYEKPRQLIPTQVITDFGISQIYRVTAKAYGYDLDRLSYDLEYSVEAGAEVLSWFHEVYGHEKDWWVRYNVGTRPRRSVRSSWLEYKSKVQKYFRENQ